MFKMPENKPRLLRITTVPISLHVLLKGQPQFMMKNGYEVLTVSADGKELAAIRNAGIPHQIINLTRKISPIADGIALWKMIRLIKSFKPDIVHTHTPKAGLIGMMAAWICRVPVRLHTVAGLPVMEAQGFKKNVLILTEKITCFCANKVYPNSNGLMDYMIDNFKSFKNKFKVLGKGSTNGINTAHYTLTPEIAELAYHLKNKYSIQQSDFVFCFIGRLVGDKGINELINVFDVLSKNNNCKLLLVGMQEPELDPLSPACLAIIQNNPNIISLGYQDDVRIALAASNVFVFPSYREGFPNVVMQAQSMGVPCIVSDINGCNELVTHNTSGIIVPVKNETALQDAMDVLMNDIEKCKSFASIARENILTHYEQSQVWNYILNAYNQMLKK
jgi:glycosyltransferase involved in cell wall biosynthesis